MPRRSLGALRNLQGYATPNTRKTTLQKSRRNQSLTIPSLWKWCGDDQNFITGSILLRKKKKICIGM
jgi:hypothetical protein